MRPETLAAAAGPIIVIIDLRWFSLASDTDHLADTARREAKQQVSRPLARLNEARRRDATRRDATRSPSRAICARPGFPMAREASAAPLRLRAARMALEVAFV